MSITRRSAKQKGRDFQQEVVDVLKRHFNLTDDDIRSTPASVSGEDIIMSNRFQEQFGFSIECKRTEKLAIWEALEQAKKNAGERIPLLVFRRSRGKIYVALEFGHFLNGIHDVTND